MNLEGPMCRPDALGSIVAGALAASGQCASKLAAVDRSFAVSGSQVSKTTAAA
jgi:hypothetical protein